LKVTTPTTPCSRLQPATRIPPQPSHTETPTHIETRTHDQWGDSIEKSQVNDDGCINVRNMLSMEAQLQSATRIPPQPSHTKIPTHIETRTHDKCGDIIDKSQVPDDGCINVRHMLSMEEVK